MPCMCKHTLPNLEKYDIFKKNSNENAGFKHHPCISLQFLLHSYYLLRFTAISQQKHCRMRLQQHNLLLFLPLHSFPNVIDLPKVFYSNISKISTLMIAQTVQRNGKTNIFFIMPAEVFVRNHSQQCKASEKQQTVTQGG